MRRGCGQPYSAQAALARIDNLAIYGPPAGPSITLAHAVAAGQFHRWRNPDDLRAGLTSGDILLSVVPIQAAANLCNRGFPIWLANAMSNGLLYILAEDAGIAAIPDLTGLHIAVPFRRDTSEITFGQLLEFYGLNTADLQSHMQAPQLRRCR